MMQQEETITSGRPVNSTGRILIVKITLLCFLVVIVIRLTKIQIIDSWKYQEIAKQQYQEKVPLPANRGSIYDCNGNILVSNTRLVSYAADPKMIGDDAEAVASQFASIFHKPAESYLAKLKTEKRFVWLERELMPDLERSKLINKFEGVVELDEPRRLYHYDDFATQTIGFTSIENTGLSGIELQFNEYLQGRDGYVIMQRDGLGRKRPSVDYPRIDPVDGNMITLTLDFQLQSIVQEELKRGVETNNALGGIAVMLDPHTGEVLAMASYPTINPNKLENVDMAATRNRPLTDMFEPGSTFKLVLTSAAVDQKIHTASDKVYAEKGVYKKNGRIIRDTEPHCMMTLQEALEASSNIAMAKFSDDVGKEKFFRYARDYGFGMQTGIELPGEINGKLKKLSLWSPATLNSMAYGYEVGVTPIQLVSAYAALANGGELMKPFVVKKIVDKTGALLYEGKPEKIRRVISEETARQLLPMFEGVVERGTGKNVKLQSVRIAGKTGTASKLNDQGYSKENYLASFIGFFPVENPKIVLLVMIDTPRAGKIFGGLVSGPVFRAIAERIINTWEPQSSNLPENIIAKQNVESSQQGNEITVPDVRYLDRTFAQEILASSGMTVDWKGEGNLVINQTPAPGVRIAKSDHLQVILDSNEEQSTQPSIARMPELRGYSIRRAINVLASDGCDIYVNGCGVVVRQSLPSGEKMKPGSRIILWCEPRMPIAMEAK